MANYTCPAPPEPEYPNRLYDHDFPTTTWGAFQKREDVNREIGCRRKYVRDVFVRGMTLRMKRMITKHRDKYPNLSSAVGDVHLNNFGSTKYTSDIDVNASLDINPGDLPPQKQVLLDFLRDIIVVYRGVLLDSARVWLPHEDDEDTLLDFISKNLDVNFYPPTWLFSPSKPLDVEGIATSGGLAMFVPRLNSRMTPTMWMNSEMAKSVDTNGNIIRPQKLYVDKYYADYAERTQRTRTEPAPLECYYSKHSDDGVAGCLVDLFYDTQQGLFGKQRMSAKNWNRRLCCMVSNNRYGSELYFQVSSIVFVVFHMQIFTMLHKGKLKDSPIPAKVLRAVAAPCFVEQLCFYEMHHQNTKYLDRAKAALALCDETGHRCIRKHIQKNRVLSGIYNTLVHEA